MKKMKIAANGFEEYIKEISMAMTIDVACENDAIAGCVKNLWRAHIWGNKDPSSMYQ